MYMKTPQKQQPPSNLQQPKHQTQNQNQSLTPNPNTNDDTNKKGNIKIDNTDLETFFVTHLNNESSTKNQAKKFTEDLRRLQRTQLGPASVSVHTTGHFQAQQRLLPVLALPLNLRWTFFEMATSHFQWSPSTAAAYWATAHSFLSMISNKTNLPAEVRSAQQILNQRKLTAPTWSSMRSEKILSATPETMRLIMNENHNGLFDVLVVAFSLGQRVGDILKLRTKEAKYIQFPYLAYPTIALTFIEGKVVEEIGPFSVFVPVTTPLCPAAMCITERMENQRDLPYLFLTLTQIVNKHTLAQATTRAETAIHNHLKSINLDMDLRALRRGGLSNMCSNGFDDEHVRKFFSKHTTTKNMTVYLDKGTLNAHQAHLMSEIVLHQIPSPTDPQEEPSSDCSERISGP